MDVRVRIPELLHREGQEITPYALAKRSGDRISLSTVYRLVKRKGQLESFESKLLEALCDVLNVEPGELLERDKRRGRK